jgi:hypothetical protein
MVPIPYLGESVGELLRITVLSIIIDLPLVATLHKASFSVQDSYCSILRWPLLLHPDNPTGFLQRIA